MTPNEILNRRFDKAMSGYRPEEVQAYLGDVAEYVHDILEDKADLEQKIMLLAEKLEEYREDEDSLRAALIGAQKLGDSVVRESKVKAEGIIAEAQKKADAMVAQIKQNIDRETNTLNKMKAEVAKFRKDIIATYSTHIELLNAIPYQEEDFPEQGSTYQQKHRMYAPAIGDSQSPEEDFLLSFEEVKSSEFSPKPVDNYEENVRKEPRHRDLGLYFGEKSQIMRNE